jgi:hypothetical protein
MNHPLRKLRPGYIAETNFYGDLIGEVDEKLQPIFKLEEALKVATAGGALPNTVCPVQHFFAPGVYVRRMLIPEGVCTIGHIHKNPCVTIIAYGDVIITTGEKREHYVGEHTFESPAGVKRAVWALKDTVLTTIHGNPTNERDPEKIFEMLIVDVYQKYTGRPTPELLEDGS